MCYTSFYTRLEENKYIYWKDLGGLCYICLQYGYKIFSDLISLIQKHVEEHVIQVDKYCKIHITLYPANSYDHEIISYFYVLRRNIFKLGR